VQERGLATRAALLDAALEVLIERGHAGTTTIEVARRAGVSRGAQLHHFPTRAELLTALVEYLFERRTADFRKAFANIPPGEDQIDAGVDVMWSLFEGPMFTAWVEVWLAARTDPELQTAVVEMDRRVTEVIRATTAELFPPGEGFDPDTMELARNFSFIVMDGLALRRLLPHDHDPRPELVLATLKSVAQAIRSTLPPGPAVPAVPPKEAP
jgi:AcrR family transcriptional regulator